MAKAAMILVFAAAVVALSGCRPRFAEVMAPQGRYAGSASCRDCHATFYEKWSTSRHGLAMQPVTAQFVQNALTAPTDDLQVGQYRYRADFSGRTPCVREQGPDGQKTYSIAHVLGGKKVYYFLTPLERGRLQVLPVAYDVHQKQWFGTTGSMIRHFTDREDRPVDWRSSALTFNTACYNCHVSQLDANYSLTTDTYHTDWGEPGINCETCHGPSAEHVRVCQAASKDQPPADLKIISTKTMSGDQINSLCASCHAKASFLSDSFPPGAGFADHFDLVTLESRDFYPDGRDLGENYTYTSWRPSPCVQSGRLDCLKCHTSSGRYRFKNDSTNQACLPCHADTAANITAHTHHPVGSPASQCVACHMPMTRFARMQRSDHSMRPPSPAATIAFGSPNACNSCHQDKPAQWAEAQLRQWHKAGHEGEIVRLGGLVQAARRQDWSRLPQILDYIKASGRQEVFTASLIRLLAACPDPRKFPVLRGQLRDPSPLVRSAAAAGLSGDIDPDTVKALLYATQDPARRADSRGKFPERSGGLPAGSL